MARSTAVLALTLLALATLPLGADAQDLQTRDGFFIGLGVGPGSFGGEGRRGRETGIAGHVLLGWAFTPRFLLAGQITGWTKAEGGTRVSQTGLTATAQFYPRAGAGFFLRGGIGGSELRQSSSTGSLSYGVDVRGFGATVGLGNDFRVSPSFSITPYGSFLFGAFDGGNASHLQVGVGVTWH